MYSATVIERSGIGMSCSLFDCSLPFTSSKDLAETYLRSTRPDEV
jgi:hypothetical protein